MYLHIGVYHFKPKRTAFRNDYCVGCNRALRAYEIRTFDACHVNFIPLIPLGHRTRWICSACGHNPHQVTQQTRKGFKIVLLVMIALGALASWVVPPDQYDNAILMWGLRIALPLLTLVAIHYVRQPGLTVSLKQMLALVEPARDETCPIDSAPLLHGETVHCPQCGIRREASPDPNL